MMIEISFTGRGGQGVVVASQMLGLAFFKADKYPQCYSVFGGERRGAPLASFLRVDDKKILLTCEIENSREGICFDASLLDVERIRTQLKPGGRILINTPKPAEAFSDLAGYRIGLIDAPAVARKAGLEKIYNTVMVGAYCGFTGIPDMASVLAAVGEMAPAYPEKNVAAARIAFDQVTSFS